MQSPRTLPLMAALLAAAAAFHPGPAPAQGRAGERVDADRPISRGALGLPSRGGPRDTVPAGTRGPGDAPAPRATAPRPTTPPPRAP